MKLIPVLASIISLSGCADPEPTPVRGDPGAMNFPLVRTTTDPGPEMNFDPSIPYDLKFGRGSGSDGYETIAIDEQGHVLKLRPRPGRLENDGHYYWEVSSSSINKKASQQIAELILEHHLPEMASEYHADVADGSQWEIRLIQGNAEKHIYCNNHFPEAIQDFAVAFDRIFFESQFDATEWRPLLDESELGAEQGLWD